MHSIGTQILEKAENLFNFRVADISMGSGHFLVAAIDRIENRFATWLQNNKVPRVFRELEHIFYLKF